MSYRSTSVYEALPDTVENHDTLVSFGYNSPMGPTGLMVVYDTATKMISAVLSEADFLIAFEPIEDQPPEE